MFGNKYNPNVIPNSPPITQASREYITYFVIICEFVYPSAFKVPISILSSSIILVIDVKLIKTATK